MNAARTALLALACMLPLAASAQWQWLDTAGRKVFSDQPPPPEVPASRILKQPGGSVAAAPATAVPVAAPEALPKPSGKDQVLEEKKKQAEAAEAEKKKGELARVAAARAENCSRARAGKATLDSGMRVAQVNAKGEREIMGDAQRAAEAKHLNEIIARDCAQAQ